MDTSGVPRAHLFGQDLPPMVVQAAGSYGSIWLSTGFKRGMNNLKIIVSIIGYEISLTNNQD